ncbi:MAG: hypothetical protein ACKOEX_05905 [Planctomycetia bacterium]
MTATKDSKKKKKKSADEAAAPAKEAAAAESPVVPADEHRPTPVPPAVTGRSAAEHIRMLADRAESLDTRRRLRAFAGQIASRPRKGRKLAALETAAGECLEQAVEAAGPRDQWLFREAAVWALAWLARSRRAGGSAGAMLDRIVGEARTAIVLLEARDTLPAGFVLSVARLFCDINACRDLEPDAASALREEIGRLVSESGSVALSGSAVVIDRICRWALCREIGQATGRLPWDDATESRFVASLSTGLRLLGGRARLPVAAGSLKEDTTAPLVDAARRAAGCRRLRKTAKVMASSGSKRRSAATETGLITRDHDDPSAAVAILRSGFGPGSLRVRIEYREAVPRIEIAVGDRLLVEGPWRWSLARDGGAIPVEGPWTSSCLESGRKATFFEITAPLADGLQIERSVTILARDQVVVLADAIVRRSGEHETGRLRFSATVPVAEGLEVEPAEETSEAFLYDSSMRCLVMPLGLPEWRSAGRGRFEKIPEGLHLEQEGHGRLFAPVWLDCDPRRIGGQLTWRQLTVADTRVNLPPSMAAGYRVQVGLDQWLLYRTLDEARNRTLLGCNVSCEFVVGRIDRAGVVRRAIEIA